MNRELALRSHAAIHPHENKSIARICNDSVPITDLLFGDNLTTLKDIKELNKLGANLAHTDK